MTSKKEVSMFLCSIYFVKIEYMSSNIKVCLLKLNISKVFNIADVVIDR